MQKFLFKIGYSFFYILSLLPFWFIYRVSDVVGFLLGNVFSYRRKIVESNISTAFPEMTEKEVKKIAAQFYYRFCDNFLETLKLLSISQKELNKRFVTDTKLLHSLYEKSNKDVSIILGHIFNWEMANPAIALHNPYKQLIIYKKVGNQFFEWIMMKIRERFNAKMISAQAFSNTFKNYKDQKYSLVLVADQNPHKNIHTAYWTKFFGKVVPFVKGPEKGAVLNDNIVVFGKIYRKKRGYYYNTLTLVTKDARNTEKGEITKKIISLTEENIREDPANYLWSHRRFKHENKYKEAYNRNLIV